MPLVAFVQHLGKPDQKMHSAQSNRATRGRNPEATEEHHRAQQCIADKEQMKTTKN